MRKNLEHIKASIALEKIVGWKPIIIQHLFFCEIMPFHELKDLIPNLTHGTLIQHLRELEEQDIIERVVYNPPNAAYSITEYGRTLETTLESMLQWSVTHLEHMNAKKEADSTQEAVK
ncbi:winged helix-turn-helix transcriptional regulator [Jeotgalibacillus soli]|uniref:HTH hxlR-type domain-containing protein n=1 Tax=Jeotgalibacillus soli TaxID=889306 RepID=A0A0C2RNJ5_9BACL|nr:winged helix-turn-helix transcriptional regulator [Jeotgalibacillus soli]KIL51850.1 hypothetical protein KP78_02200 [Jeotgalibacillus soli]